MCENMYREQDALFDKGIIEKLELVQVNKKQKNIHTAKKNSFNYD